MSKRILIVDDEERIRKLIRQTLEFEEDNFEIYEADDGDQAVKKAKEVNPHLMILDVMLPGKSGYEVCKDIKEYPDTKGVYVLFLTARGSAISERTGSLSGGDDFMSKPFAPDELVTKVKKALGLA